MRRKNNQISRLFLNFAHKVDDQGDKIPKDCFEALEMENVHHPILQKTTLVLLRLFNKRFLI